MEIAEEVVVAGTADKVVSETERPSKKTSGKRKYAGDDEALASFMSEVKKKKSKHVKEGFELEEAETEEC